MDTDGHGGGGGSIAGMQDCLIAGLGNSQTAIFDRMNRIIRMRQTAGE